MDRRVVSSHALTRARPERRDVPRGTSALAVALLAVLGLFLAWPIARLLGRALSIRGFTDVAQDARIREVVWFSLWQATASGAAVFALALPTAAVLARYQFRGRGWVLALASAPFTLPTVVVGSAFLALAPDRFRRTAGLIICAHIFFNFGYALRSLVAAWERVDPALHDAAATLGASPRRVFASITAPLLRRPCAEVAAVVFALCFTSFGVVLMLGGPRRSTIDVEVYRQALDYGRFDRSAVLAIGQLLILVPLLLAARRRMGALRGGASLRTFARRPVTAVQWSLAGAATALVVAITAAPLASLVTRSLRGPDAQVSLRSYRGLAEVTRGSGLIETPLHSMAVSMRAAIIVAIMAVTVATLVATLLAGTPGPRRPIRGALRLLTVLPLATSAVTLGLGVLIAFSKSPFAWRTMWFMLPVVQSVVCLPFVLAIIVPAFAELCHTPRDAARTLGASPWRVWWSVDLPRVRRSLGAATGTAFAVGIGEFGAASLLARPARETMPIAIARLAGRPGAALAGQASALAVVLAAVTAAATLLSLASGQRSPRSS